eukprot:scaffold291197_cov14-Tisochrysis_lutea.AAC.1
MIGNCCWSFFHQPLKLGVVKAVISCLNWTTCATSCLNAKLAHFLYRCPRTARMTRRASRPYCTSSIV